MARKRAMVRKLRMVGGFRNFNKRTMISETHNIDCKISDLQIGKAGEYLVCADLILNGYVAYPSEQGLPYDVVMDYKGRLLKIQVKTTRGHRKLAQRKNGFSAYQFNIGRNGKNGSKKIYQCDSVDIFALVALDTKEIAYLPYFNTQSTMNFRVPGLRGSYYDEQGLALKSKVCSLREAGLSCPDIAKETGLTLSNVYKYSSNVSIEKSGTSGVYFDTKTIWQCLSGLDGKWGDSSNRNLHI